MYFIFEGLFVQFFCAWNAHTTKKNYPPLSDIDLEIN